MKSLRWLIPLSVMCALAWVLNDRPAGPARDVGPVVDPTSSAENRPEDVPEALVELERMPPESPIDGAATARSSETLGLRQSASDANPAEDVPPPGARLRAQLFEHASWHPEAPGRIWDLGRGLTTAGLAFDNDAASEAFVPDGATMTLFVDGDGQGRRVVLPPGRHDLRSIDFDETVSSAFVSNADYFDPATPRGPEDAVELHQHLPREGELGEAWRLRLRKGQATRLFRAADGHFLNNEASAAWVPSGYEVTLFENGQGLGTALVLGPGFHELLPYQFNDRASSARVRRTR
ncbi:MAG: hypothetical protein AAGG01_22280 [Planctomycetota bacterium]